jgi:hypothetical protein
MSLSIVVDDGTKVFTLSVGMNLEGLQKMFGDYWDKLEEDVQNDIRWATMSSDKTSYNPGAATAVNALISELADGVVKDKVTADQAEFLWEKAIETLGEHDLFGPRLHILFKDYSKGDPMLMLGHILNVSEDFLSAKAGIRK